MTGNFPKKANMCDAPIRHKRTVSENDQALLQFNANIATQKAMESKEIIVEKEGPPEKGQLDSGEKGKRSSKYRRRRGKP